MDKIYERIEWENGQESQRTPLSADNLNKMDKGIDDLDDRVVDLYETKATNIGDLKDVALSGVKSGNVLKFDGEKWVNGSGGGGGTGGTSDYLDLDNKPLINGVMLVGNKTAEDLGLNTKGGAELVTLAELNALDKSTLEDGQQFVVSDDYSSTICQTIAECEASESLDDVASASALVEVAHKTNNVYSTDEVVIGEFFGKKLYRKCYDLGTIACTTSVQTKTLDDTLNTSNIDRAINLYSTFVNTNGSYCLNNTSDNSAYIRPYVATNGLLASVKGSASGNLNRCLVVIEYTKVGE